MSDQRAVVKQALQESGDEFWRARLDEMEEEIPSIPKTLRGFDYDPFEVRARFQFENLDDALAAVADCVADERGSQWRLGDVVASAVDIFGPYGTYKKLASVCAYTTRRLKTFEVLARTFPPELCFPDQPLLLYEMALRADDPVLALKTALDEEWSPRELSDAISEARGETVSRVKLFSGEAELEAVGSIWNIVLDAGRDWPEGDGVYRCHVTVKQIIQEDSNESASG